MRSALVVRLSSLGDVLFGLAVVERLKRAKPEARISFLVEDRFAAVPRAHRGVDEVIVFPRRRGLGAVARHLAALRRRRFDAVIDLQGNAKSALHLAMLRGSRRIGFAPGAGAGREGSHLLVDDTVVPPAAAHHRVDRFLSLLAPLDILTHRENPAPLVVDAAERAAAEAVAAMPREGPLVVLHPGTSAFGTFKRWPPERFAAVARSLAADRGALCLVSGGPGEEPLVAEVVEASSGAARALGPVPSLLALAAVLGEADLVVAADTGPLHLANRMGTPVLGLFGPKDPSRYGPAYEPSAVVRRDDVPCSPCTRRWCEAPACMTALGADPVIAAAHRLLDARREHAAAAGRRRFSGC